jgi:hypothetical protein
MTLAASSAHHVGNDRAENEIRENISRVRSIVLTKPPRV